jgi:hypothetical protein
LHAVGAIASIIILSVGQQHGGVRFPPNADVFGGSVEHFFYYLRTSYKQRISAELKLIYA